MSIRSFSVLERSRIIRDWDGQEADLIVIGGGITGAGIALDAASRGLRTVLLEMQDFASGTSSRSTKLVHGGLRYLKQGEIRLVAEVGKERAIVYENGPHVTQPEWMILPIYRDGTFGKWTTSWGLRLYDFLAGVKKTERRRMLTREQVLEKEPLLKPDGLIGGGYYVEYRTDDARLTLEVVKKAVEKGATAVNYCRVEEFLYEDGKLVGVKAVDLIHHQVIHVRGKKIVNAAGPWVDVLRELDRSRTGKTLQLTKGVHIVFDQSRFPLRQAIYFDTPDGRMVFAIPRDGKTYVGTTDTVYRGKREHPRWTVRDRSYLLQAVNFMFPGLGLKEEDIESSWAGLRPLIHQEGKGPSEISRRDEIWQSPSGLISIAGGKLTGYRKMAEAVVDLVTDQLRREEGREYPPCQTKHIPLSGGEVGGSAGFPRFVEMKIGEGEERGLHKEEAEWLVRLYGSNIDRVFAMMEKHQPIILECGLPLGLSLSLLYSMEEEMTVTPADYFVRRTGGLLFRLDWVRQWMEQAISFMGRFLGWQPEQQQAYREELEELIRHATQPLEEE